MKDLKICSSVCCLGTNPKQENRQAVDEAMVPRSFREARRQVSQAGRVFGSRLTELVRWLRATPPLPLGCTLLSNLGES